jgi:hypothetical protein
MKKYKLLGLIGVGVFVAGVMNPGGAVLADTRIAACWSKPRGLCIYRSGWLSINRYLTSYSKKYCNQLAGTSVIWNKVGPTGSQGLKGDQGLRGLQGIQGIPGSKVVQATSSSVTPNNPDNLLRIASAQGFQPVTGISVTVNNTEATLVSSIVQFSADAGVSDLAEIRLGYSIDGGAVQFFGPQNFANNSQFWETRSNLSVISIPPGIHTIQPFLGISAGQAPRGGAMGCWMIVY